MRLTTKMLLIFIGVTLVSMLWLGAFAIPALRDHLYGREVTYVTTFLENAAQNTRYGLLALERRSEEMRAAGEDPELARRELFLRLNDEFAKFYYHESGRLFVIDEAGNFVITSDQILKGRSVNTSFLFDDGTRGKLLAEIKSSHERVQQYHFAEADQLGHLIDKMLFVTPVVGTPYFAGISVDQEDLEYYANMVAKSLWLALIITVLVGYLFFHIFYLRVRNRFEAIIGNAQLIARGQYDLQIADPHGDEVGTLARTIDELAAALRQKQQLEQQLHQAQKMEMVGTLASGVVHDFNNVLAGIVSALDLVSHELRHPGPNGPDLELVRETVQVAQDCAVRGSDTVDQMMSFARTSAKKVQILDLGAVVPRVAAFCRSSFDKRIEVVVDQVAPGATVKADRSQLEQALLNICINARDAMPDGGTLKLRVQRNEGPPPPRPEMAPDGWYCLTIADNGSGMPEEIRSHIFEPFFTSKKNGNGLGLAMAYKIVDEHHGWITVDSQLGVGTSFHLGLPHCPGQPPARAPADPALPATTNLPRGRVLVVDDELLMRQLTEDLLSRLGYQPLSAASGEEALSVLASPGEEFAVVILDLQMPRLSGAETFDALRAQRPEQPVLLISGAKRDPRIGELLARGCDGFLHKPFSLEELAHALEEIRRDPAPPVCN